MFDELIVRLLCCIELYQVNKISIKLKKKVYIEKKKNHSLINMKILIFLHKLRGNYVIF